MICQAAIVRENDILFLVATMNYSSITRKSTEEEKLIFSYIDIEKALLKALILRGKTSPIPSRVTVHGADYYFHLWFERGFIFLALADAGFSHSLAFTFLEQMAFGFFEKSESESLKTRPYSLMKLEPWLQDLRHEYNSKPKRRKTFGDDEIYALEIVDILSHHASGLVRKTSKFRMATFRMWETRILVSLCISMCLLDIYAAFDLWLQWFSELRQEDQNTSEKIHSTLVIFSHYGFTIILGLLSPIYLFLASLFHLRQPISQLGKLIVTTHTWILFGQLAHVFLFEKNEYQRPDNMVSLTSLQIWATIFDSFSIPFLVVFLKLILLQVVIVKGFFAPLSFRFKKIEKYN